MSKRKWLPVMSLLIIAGLWLLPVYGTVYAQDETSATTESEERDPTGAGMVIILIGLGALLMVGAASSSRQSQENSPVE